MKSMKQQFQRGDRVYTVRQLGFLPSRSSGTIVRSFVHSDLCMVHFDQRAEPRIVSRYDLSNLEAVRGEPEKQRAAGATQKSLYSR
jgi:hypothetical protein